MSKNIELLIKRTSVRLYKKDKIEQSKIDLLKQVANSAPSSINAQSFSCLFIEDENAKKFIANKCWNQQHIIDAPLFILIIADSNRVEWALEQAKIKIDKHNADIESMLFSFVDATIATTMINDAALLLDLSTCYIGAVRFCAKELIEYFNIEGKASPVVGLTVGYAKNINDQKPKVNKVYFEKYDIKKVLSEIDSYNINLNDYYLKRNNNSKIENYISSITKYYEIFNAKSNDFSNHYNLIFFNKNTK